MKPSRPGGLVAFFCVAFGLAAWSLEAASQGMRAESRSMRLLGHDDLQARSGYHPVIQRQTIDNEEHWIAYVGHHGGESMNPLRGRVENNGTSIVDVTDPRNPVYLHHLAPLEGTSGAQMVQTCTGDELPRGQSGRTYLLRAGASYHQVFDVTDPSNPRLLSTPSANLTDTHKNAWECSTGIAYLVSGVQGWRTQRMTQIFDLSDPANPRFIRNFGLDGQQPGTTVDPVPMELHGCIPVVERNRIYCGHGTAARGVFAILDRDRLLNASLGDPANPTSAELREPVVGEIRLPDFMGAHTSFPVFGIEIAEFANDEVFSVRDIAVIVNESTANECTRQARQMAYMVDITDEAHPWPISTFNVSEESGDFCSRGGRFGAHASNENFTPIYYGKLVFVSWFNAGVRAVDIRDPYNPTEVGYYIPATTANTDQRCIEVNGVEQCKIAIQTNNVEVDDRGYIYLVDRANTGLDIVELTGSARAIADFPD